jgi:hypothetical protein
MSAPIRFVETTDLASVVVGDVSDQVVVLRLDSTQRCLLRFQLDLSHANDVEALRYARRAMIREERTRGLEWDEPSMEDPIVTAREIRWLVLVSQASWCRQKVAELTERANRACEALRALGT